MYLAFTAVEIHLQQAVIRRLWTKMDKKRQKWTKIDKKRRLWTSLDKNGQNWTKIDAVYGRPWTSMVD